MKRREIQNQICKFLEEQGIEGLIWEFFVTKYKEPGDTAYNLLQKRRSFITTGFLKEQIEDVRKFISSMFGICDEQLSQSRNEFRNSSLFDRLSDVYEECNWRGRIFKFGASFDTEKTDRVTELCVKSQWRLVITKIDNNFVCHKELVPSYLFSSELLLPNPDLKDGLRDFLEIIADPKNIDAKYDFVQVFAAKARNLPYRTVKCFKNNQEEIRADSLSEEYKQDKEGTTNDLYRKINNFFN